MIKRKRRLFKTLTVILATSMLGVTATSAFTSQSRSVLAASADFTVKANTDQNAKPNVVGEFADPSKYQGDIPVQVLGINDLHGNIDTVTKQTRIGNPVKSYSNTGTAARLAAYLDNAEAQFFKENPSANKENSFRVESGDMVGASPSVSALLQDEPTMHVLKAMGIEIGTLGNHEFDEGLGEFYRILEGNAPEKGKFNKITEDYPHQNTNMEMVVSNVFDKNGQIPYNWKPYTIKTVEAGGKTSKIGFIGIDTSTLPGLVLNKYFVGAGYHVTQEAEAIDKYAKELRAQGVNAIVVLAHTGVQNTGDSADGPTIDILRTLNEIDPNNSVDLYVAGHSHQYANANIDGRTNLVQAISYGMAYDDSIGYIDPITNDFASGSLVSHVYPVLSEKDDPEVKTNEAVKAIVDDAETRVKNTTKETIGRTADGKTISKTQNAAKESAVGDLVVDAQLAEAKREGVDADFAFTNEGGGIRADIKTDNEGNISWENAQAVQPFGNSLSYVKLTGQKILDAITDQLPPASVKRFGYGISGLNYYYTEENGKYKIVKAYDAKGKEIDPDKEYTVVTNEYQFGFTPFKEVKDQATKLEANDTDAFINYIKEQKVIKAPELDRKVLLTADQVKNVDQLEKARLAKYQETTKPAEKPNKNPETSGQTNVPDTNNSSISNPSVSSTDATNVTTITTAPANNTQTSSNNAQPEQATPVVKYLYHNAYLYDQTGKRTNTLVLKRFTTINTYGKVTINGKKFYRVDKGYYIAANNIDPVKRSLKHNSFVYNKLGKLVKRTTKATKKGRQINTYGSIIKINGKRFYTVGKNQFVKVSNF